jgi:hypothetical protein
MTTPQQILSNRLKPRPYSFLRGESEKPEAPIPRLAADMRKAKKVERVWLSFASFKTLLLGKPAETKQPRLLGVQSETELLKSLLEGNPKLDCISLVLETHHEIVRETHDNYFTGRFLFPPALDPQVEHVVEVDIREERRNRRSLRCSFFRGIKIKILENP